MTKILVIEDEASLREDIIEMLELLEYEVAGAENGLVGLQIAQEHHPDLILCDIMMNKLDGYGVLAEIRKNPELSATPFIFLTAKSDRASLRHGMELGADDYLSKPFTSYELMTAIQTRLARQTTLAQNAEKQLDEAREQLMRLVTHELRTPLTSINMVVDIISKQLKHLQPQQLTELLETLTSGSKRLSHLVEQMVLTTQIEAGVFRPEAFAEDAMPARMWEILVASINLGRRFAVRSPNVSIALEDKDQTAMVNCSLAALKHALAEVISNALTFSPEGATVTITQWKAEGWVWITVVDQGEGIPPEKLEQALENFGQVDRELHEQQGMGLGLPLARKIIEIHKGRMEVHSVVGKGTQVMVGLPAM
jgi:two-component system, sensor histidine kinase and response regulator